MIASFFQSLEEHGVAYLLISGQATVLYGAATFSEDIDLWLNPAAENKGKGAVDDRGRVSHVTPMKRVATVGNDALRRSAGIVFSKKILESFPPRLQRSPE
jgi:hypothetical protein